MEIQKAYEDNISRSGHVRDPAQQTVVDQLADLQDRIVEHEAYRPNFLARLSRQKSAADGVKGLYLWGGVGRGKTFLMDLFFENLDIKKKRRIHFHRMMHDVHRRLGMLGDTEDPLDVIAADMASETQVLCFDEFFVSDIADAMILSRLLEGLFRRRVTLIATSNANPDGLYKNGLQRAQFLPAIEQIKKHTTVIEMDSGTDYRLRLLREAGTYLTPDDEFTRKKLNTFFNNSATSQVQDNRKLEINGRSISAYKCAKGVAWFDFEAICDGPRSQTDYIEIARWYPSIIVSNVPLLDPMRDDQTRRFIALVDEFYDRRVKLIISASCEVEKLYSGKRLEFEFNRTASRLVEMQSDEYLALPHLA